MARKGGSKKTVKCPVPSMPKPKEMPMKPMMGK